MMRKIYFVFCTGLFLTACTPRESLILSPSHLIAEKGDTIYSIAQEHQVNVRDLIRLNRLQPPYTIHEGQILTLPDNMISADTPIEPTQDAVQEASSVTENAAQPLAPFSSEKKEGPCLLDADLTQTNSENFENPNPSVTPSSPRTPQPAPETYECSTPSAASPSPKGPAVKSSKNNRLIEESSVCFEHPKQNQTARSKETPAKQAVISQKSSKNQSSVQQQEISFLMPSKGKIVSKYGESLADGKKSRGVLIKATGKKMVCAAAEGEVLFVGHELNGKNLVIIKHPGGWMSAYLPFRTICVKAHQPVKPGQKIGFLQGEELYFEVLKNRAHVNPLNYIKTSE